MSPFCTIADESIFASTNAVFVFMFVHFMRKFISGEGLCHVYLYFVLGTLKDICRQHRVRPVIPRECPSYPSLKRVLYINSSLYLIQICINCSQFLVA